MEKKPTRESIERAVIGALRSAINDHGPITGDKITSAAKRVVGNLRNTGLSVSASSSGHAQEILSKDPQQ